MYKKLVKCYPTISKRTGNHHQLANTDGFLSFMSKETEYHRYAVYNDIDLPPPLCPDTDSDDDTPLYKVYFCYWVVGALSLEAVSPVPFSPKC